MRLERLNVIRETEDESKIKYFKSLGFIEVEKVEEVEKTTRKKTKK